ncbi:MAG TPA: YvcK family protein [Desulfobulbaceae bacterium]|nr:YvcK family protein [Desulfobulbaceae bacterium]
MASVQRLQQCLQDLSEQRVAPLDFLPDGNLAERVISLLLDGIPDDTPPAIAALFTDLIRQVSKSATTELNVVVFGGGTGLSNIVGGDSRRREWAQSPFEGLKEIFPRCHSIVCITDDGGSTGELLKDLPLIALGDLRHVLLSSIQLRGLKNRFDLDTTGAEKLAAALHAVFNYRFITCPDGVKQLLLDTSANLEDIPDKLLQFLQTLTKSLFIDKRLTPTLNRPQCLGNLLLAAAIYRQLDPSLGCTELAASYQVMRTATIRGLADICLSLGMHSHAVLPCTTTNAQLQVLYTNGVQVTGEHKSSYCRRNYPVDRVFVEFYRKPFVQPEVMGLIAEADILLFAPGSLYTSIIPIMQAPGIADAIRENLQAMKLLVTNIWVQKGETDVARDAPDRKFHVSDLISAYHRNIPGGVNKLFSHILSLDLADIPGSVLQRYALEDKAPIYLDRKRVRTLGFKTIAVPVFSREQLKHRRVIQHDPESLARSVQALYSLWSAGLLATETAKDNLQETEVSPRVLQRGHLLPCLRYEAIVSHCRYLSAEQISLSSRFDQKLTGKERNWLMARVIEIIWNHPDILIEHLQNVRGVCMVEPTCWKRCQQWDNVFSFYDPQDQRIKIRQDQARDLNRFEMAFLVALGQSLLGNYAKKKNIAEVTRAGGVIGRIYSLTVQEPERLESFFDHSALKSYLELARMRSSEEKEGLYTRLINADEGFTPPGLLFGLFYAWYLDNRFAPNIEYKMSIMKNVMSDLIPEQVRIVDRRRKLINFFREHVFQDQ